MWGSFIMHEFVSTRSHFPHKRLLEHHTPFLQVSSHGDLTLTRPQIIALAFRHCIDRSIAHLEVVLAELIRIALLTPFDWCPLWLVLEKANGLGVLRRTLLVPRISRMQSP